LILAATGSFQNGYHLEFAVEDSAIAHRLCDKLAPHDIFANISTADSHVRVYIKDSESICNLLALVGANQSLYKLNDQIAMRSVMNATNRRANCDNANIAKQIQTSTKQVEIISALDLKKLPEDLRQTALARLENPDATMDELAQILGISKSGTLHRMKKLTQSQGS